MGNLQVLKDRTVDYLVSDAPGGWGTVPYQGPELFESHSSLNITNRQYDIFVKYSKVVMKKTGKSKEVFNEALKTFEDMRDPIVDPKGDRMKQLKADSARQEAENLANPENDYDPTGFGMSTSRETAAKWAAAEQRRKELKEKMEKFKKEKAAQEKKAAAAAAAKKAAEAKA